MICRRADKRLRQEEHLQSESFLIQPDMRIQYPGLQASSVSISASAHQGIRGRSSEYAIMHVT